MRETYVSPGTRVGASELTKPTAHLLCAGIVRSAAMIHPKAAEDVLININCSFIRWVLIP